MARKPDRLTPASLAKEYLEELQGEYDQLAETEQEEDKRTRQNAENGTRLQTRIDLLLEASTRRTLIRL